MKKQFLQLAAAAMILVSCNNDEIADWKIASRNDGLMSRTFKVDSTQSGDEPILKASENSDLDDDYYQFNGPANTMLYIGKAVRYQGKKLMWPTLPQVTRFNWQIDGSGNPYSSNMGGNAAAFAPSQGLLMIAVRPVAPGQRWQWIWLHPVADGVGMNGVTP